MTTDEHKDFSEQDVQERFEAIGRTMVEQGLFAEAVEAYKELIRSYPASRWAANAYMAIAHCYHAMGEEQEELRALEDIITQFPDHVVATRARGAIAALRERHREETGPGADLHGAVRRLTRQVDRMRQAQQRRAWLGAVTFLVLVVVVVWAAVRHSSGVPSRSLRDLDKRVTALESAVQVLSSGPAAAPPAAPSLAPAVTVTPIEPGPRPAAAPAKPTPKPAPAVPKPAVAPKPKPTPKPKPAVTKPPSPLPAVARTYTVKDGDSLWRIAGRELGDGRRVDEIARLNGLKPPYNLQVGDKLKLPARR